MLLHDTLSKSIVVIMVSTVMMLDDALFVQLNSPIGVYRGAVEPVPATGALGAAHHEPGCS
jgi:hypothetical protein